VAVVEDVEPPVVVVKDRVVRADASELDGFVFDAVFRDNGMCQPNRQQQQDADGQRG